MHHTITLTHTHRADRASRYNNDKATKISMIEEKNKLKAKAKEDFRASLDEDRMLVCSIFYLV